MPDRSSSEARYSLSLREEKALRMRHLGSIRKILKRLNKNSDLSVTQRCCVKLRRLLDDAPWIEIGMGVSVEEDQGLSRQTFAEINRQVTALQQHQENGSLSPSLKHSYLDECVRLIDLSAWRIGAGYDFSMGDFHDG